MAFSAHRTHGQAPIAEAAQLEIECLSPGRQSSNPQQHGEPDGQGLSSLERVGWEAPGTGGFETRLGVTRTLDGSPLVQPRRHRAGGPLLSELPDVRKQGDGPASDPWFVKRYTPETRVGSSNLF